MKCEIPPRNLHIFCLFGWRNIHDRLEHAVGLVNQSQQSPENMIRIINKKIHTNKILRIKYNF